MWVEMDNKDRDNALSPRTNGSSSPPRNKPKTPPPTPPRLRITPRETPEEAVPLLPPPVKPLGPVAAPEVLRNSLPLLALPPPAKSLDVKPSIHFSLDPSARGPPLLHALSSRNTTNNGFAQETEEESTSDEETDDEEEGEEEGEGVTRVSRSAHRERAWFLKSSPGRPSRSPPPPSSGRLSHSVAPSSTSAPCSPRKSVSSSSTSTSAPHSPPSPSTSPRLFTSASVPPLSLPSSSSSSSLSSSSSSSSSNSNSNSIFERKSVLLEAARSFKEAFQNTRNSVKSKRASHHSSTSHSMSPLSPKQSPSSSSTPMSSLTPRTLLSSSGILSLLTSSSSSSSSSSSDGDKAGQSPRRSWTLEQLEKLFPTFPKAMMRVMLQRHDGDSVAVQKFLHDRGWRMNLNVFFMDDVHCSTPYYHGYYGDDLAKLFSKDSLPPPLSSSARPSLKVDSVPNLSSSSLSSSSPVSSTLSSSSPSSSSPSTSTPASSSVSPTLSSSSPSTSSSSTTSSSRRPAARVRRKKTKEESNAVPGASLYPVLSYGHKGGLTPSTSTPDRLSEHMSSGTRDKVHSKDAEEKRGGKKKTREEKKRFLTFYTRSSAQFESSGYYVMFESEEGVLKTMRMPHDSPFLTRSLSVHLSLGHPVRRPSSRICCVRCNTGAPCIVLGERPPSPSSSSSSSASNLLHNFRLSHHKPNLSSSSSPSLSTCASSSSSSSSSSSLAAVSFLPLPQTHVGGHNHRLEESYPIFIPHSRFGPVVVFEDEDL